MRVAGENVITHEVLDMSLRCGVGGGGPARRDPTAAAAGLVVEYVCQHAASPPVAHAATSDTHKSLEGSQHQLPLATATGTPMHNDGASWRRPGMLELTLWTSSDAPPYCSIMVPALAT